MINEKPYYSPPKKWFKRQLYFNWLVLLLVILLLAYTTVGYIIMRRKIEEAKRDSYQERIEHSLDWSRMLCDKQELIIDQLYERKIISWETQKALQHRNELWLKQQMQRKVKNGYK